MRMLKEEDKSLQLLLEGTAVDKYQLLIQHLFLGNFDSEYLLQSGYTIYQGQQRIQRHMFVIQPGR